MERETLARGLVVAALACMGLFFAAANASAEQGIQGTQSSTDATATTGDSTGDNTSAFTGGPTATGATGANSQQQGSNAGTVDQSGTASSGDPVAGGQVVGAVADDVTVQLQNDADAPTATSGDALVDNTADIALGPQATTIDGPANASQLGDNILDVSQTAGAATGDAVAGAQVVGIVGGGEHEVQAQNTGFFADALTGLADIDQELDVSAGPFAFSEFDEAQASQVGDNDAVLTQVGDGESGDALASAQVVGIVGGSATVQVQNTSEAGVATSGDVDVEQDIDQLNVAMLGPSVDAGTTGQAQQTGSNTAEVVQDLSGSSGDAIAGGQVTGAVGDQGGFFELQSQQASEDDDALSGDVLIENDTDDMLIGPRVESTGDASAGQIGDNAVTIEQSADAQTGDAVAGAQVAGAVGYEDVTVQNQNTAIAPTAESGLVDDQGGETNTVDVELGPQAFSGDDAQASQVGDNTIVVDQIVTAETGDALAGAQVTGVVATGTTVTIQNQNDAVDAFAISGEITDAQNEIDDLEAGPFASGEGDASASQIGSNDVVVTQVAAGASGDAVAGGQVTGVVAGSGAEVTIQNQNTSEFNTAESGEVNNVDNDIDDIDSVGPFAQSFDDGDAQAAQTGDNALVIDQVGEANSGDAVAGGQVTGVVAGAGSEITVQNTNASEFDIAISGELDGLENGIDDVDAFGPTALAEEDAQATQNGDNALAISQTYVGGTGDAIAGAQVTGVVAGAGSEIEIQNANTADTATADSGDADLDAVNEIDDIESVGPWADTVFGDAQASQIGDNDVLVGQDMDISTGDAVAGAQVTGVVAGAGSEVTVQVTNVSFDAVAETGLIDVENEINDIDGVGPLATTIFGDASAAQVGDNAVAVDQAILAQTGDAVAGAQVTGTVAGAGSEITVQGTNASELSTAISGDVDDALNEVDGIDQVGPHAESLFEDAQATQSGDNDAAIAQSIEASSGDAVAGGQIAGAVAGAGSDITIQNQNVSVEDSAETGDVDAENEIEDIAVGPQAATLFEDATASQVGDNVLTTDQTLVAESGDAVAGSQITGVVAGAGSEVEVQLQNTAELAFAESGFVDVENQLDADVGPGASTIFGDAAASLIGDAEILFAQDLQGASGDAVAGSQVTGLVGAEGADVQVANDDDASAAFADDVDALNTADGNLGALADTIDGDATASQSGDTAVAGGQDLAADVGDALGGSQVTGDVGTAGELVDEAAVFGDLSGLGSAGLAA